MSTDPAPAPEAAAPEPPPESPLYATLVEQLGDPSPLLRGHACWVLGQLRFRPCQRRLSRVLGKDVDPLVRLSAAQALAHMGGSGAAQALIRGLKDGDELVRDACVMGLGSMRDPQGLGPLEELRRKARDLPEGFEKRLSWAIRVLKGIDDPGQTADRRRGGISRKISRYLQQVTETPRSGNAHNNLAVAYFHATEFDLAVRHCLLAKALGAQVDWLWGQLTRAGHDPAKVTLGEDDRRFLAAAPGPLKLEPEPERVEIKGLGDGDEPGGGEHGSRLRD